MIFRVVFPLLQWLGVLRCVRFKCKHIEINMHVFVWSVCTRIVFWSIIIESFDAVRVPNRFHIEHIQTGVECTAYTYRQSVDGMLFALYEHECEDNFLNIQTNNIFHSIIMKCCIANGIFDLDTRHSATTILGFHTFNLQIIGIHAMGLLFQIVSWLFHSYGIDLQWNSWRSCVHLVESKEYTSLDRV